MRAIKTFLPIGVLCIFIGAGCSHFPSGNEGDDDPGDDAGPGDPDGGGPTTCPDVACPEGLHCEDGMCVPDEPTTCDPACPEGQHCESGTCVPDDPPPECDDDGDCDEGEECHDGTCVCDGGDDDDDGSDGECKAGKALLCHYPPGHPENRHALCVGTSAVPAHLAHGDTPGACP